MNQPTIRFVQYSTVATTSRPDACKQLPQSTLTDTGFEESILRGLFTFGKPGVNFCQADSAMSLPPRSVRL